MTPDTVETSDAELAAACARRDESAHARRQAEAAFRTLYDRHAKRLIAFLAARVNMAALDDVHQDVWTKVWRAVATGFRGGNFRAWVHQIARNVVIDHLRKRHHEPLAEVGEVVDHRHWDGTRPVETDRYVALARCLQKLEKAKALVADLGRRSGGGRG